MAAEKPKAGGSEKGAAPKKNAGTAKKQYKVSGGNLERVNQFCPKCGPGYFLGKHTNRLYCGKCHYTEFVKK